MSAVRVSGGRYCLTSSYAVGTSYTGGDMSPPYKGFRISVCNKRVSQLQRGAAELTVERVCVKMEAIGNGAACRLCEIERSALDARH